MRKGPEPRRTPAFATTLRRGLVTTEYLYVKLLCPSVHTSYSRYSSNTILLPRYPSLNPKSRSSTRSPVWPIDGQYLTMTHTAWMIPGI